MSLCELLIHSAVLPGLIQLLQQSSIQTCLKALCMSPITASPQSGWEECPSAHRLQKRGMAAVKACPPCCHGNAYVGFQGVLREASVRRTS